MSKIGYFLVLVLVIILVKLVFEVPLNPNWLTIGYLGVDKISSFTPKLLGPLPMFIKCNVKC